MTNRYSPVIESKEILDVFFSILSGNSTVKDIQQSLKQPKPTISTKLSALARDKVVVKEKWNFIIDFDNLTKIWSDYVVSVYVKASEKKVTEIINNPYFPHLFKLFFQCFGQIYGIIPIRKNIEERSEEWIIAIRESFNRTKQTFNLQRLFILFVNIFPEPNSDLMKQFKKDKEFIDVLNVFSELRKGIKIDFGSILFTLIMIDFIKHN